MKFIPFIVVLQLAGFVLQAQINLNQGLQLHYSFNGSATDLSENGNNGIVNGATLVSDRWGNPNGAYRFDGLDDYIEVPNSPSLSFSNDSFTLYTLVNVKGFYNGLCRTNYLISRGRTELVPGSFCMGYVDGYVTNHNNCTGPPIDSTKENFFGWLN